VTKTETEELEVPGTTPEDRAAYEAAKILHEGNPRDSITVARQMRNMLQPLLIYVGDRKELVMIVDRLTALAQSFEGH
jgi:hypothetical protein